GFRYRTVAEQVTWWLTPLAGGVPAAQYRRPQDRDQVRSFGYAGIIRPPIPQNRRMALFDYPCGRKARAALFVVAACALGFAMWKAGLAADRWQSVCALAFSPDGQTLAAGLYGAKVFNEDFHWCNRDVVQTVTLFNAESGPGAEILHHDRDPNTYNPIGSRT